MKKQVRAGSIALSAALLRAIVMETINRLQDPKAYNDHFLATDDAERKNVSVWSPEATQFSELGHIYRATRAVCGGMPGIIGRHYKAAAERAGDLIDAQVQYLYRVTLVSFAVDEGREALVAAMHRVAKRLAEGDEALITPAASDDDAEDGEELDDADRHALATFRDQGPQLVVKSRARKRIKRLEQIGFVVTDRNGLGGPVIRATITNAGIAAIAA